MAVAALEHGPGCHCTRCVGFEKGNQLATRHSGYSLAGTDERASEIADEIRPTLPAFSAADEMTLQLLAVTLVRIERAASALSQVDDHTEGQPIGPYLVDGAVKYQRLREDMRGWIGLARRLLNDLGATPMARSKLGLQVAEARRAVSIVEYYRAREAAGLPVRDDEEGEDE